jgi:uncharacterized SAM-binding protein YcdF (DUF218 family)
MIYLHKILPLLVSPLFLVITLVLLASIFRSKKAGLVASGILIVSSLPVFSNKLMSCLESDYSLSSAASVKTADAIVVLSGMVRTIKGANGLVYEWGEASDRIFAGIDLIKEKKAPVLILTGGKLPWSLGKPEGLHLRDISMKFGVPSEIILLTEIVQNTDQEAKAVAKLIKKEKPNIILVTSAFHMSRAKRVFEAAGITVSPFPVDFLSGAHETTILGFIPSAGAFQQTSFFFREVIGRLYYRIKY